MYTERETRAPPRVNLRSWGCFSILLIHSSLMSINFCLAVFCISPSLLTVCTVRECKWECDKCRRRAGWPVPKDRSIIHREHPHPPCRLAAWNTYNSCLTTWGEGRGVGTDSQLLEKRSQSTTKLHTATWLWRLVIDSPNRFPHARAGHEPRAWVTWVPDLTLPAS